MYEGPVPGNLMPTILLRFRGIIDRDSITLRCGRPFLGRISGPSILRSTARGRQGDRTTKYPPYAISNLGAMSSFRQTSSLYPSRQGFGRAKC